MNRALIVGLLGASLLGTSVLAQTAAKLSSKSAPKADNPFASPMVPWSLEPEMGSAERRLGIRAMAPKHETNTAGVETITVFGRKRAPTEEALHYDAPTAESWQSDAAQPMVPGLGDSCSYKSGCFDKSQPGLFSTIPSLFKGN